MFKQPHNATHRFVQEAQRWLTEYLAEIDAGTCPHCKQPMSTVKRGWSIYASPYGHRLGTGKPE